MAVTAAPTPRGPKSQLRRVNASASSGAQKLPNSSSRHGSLIPPAKAAAPPYHRATSIPAATEPPSISMRMRASGEGPDGLSSASARSKCSVRCASTVLGSGGGSGTGSSSRSARSIWAAAGAAKTASPQRHSKSVRSTAKARKRIRRKSGRFLKRNASRQYVVPARCARSRSRHLQGADGSFGAKSGNVTRRIGALDCGPNDQYPSGNERRVFSEVALTLRMIVTVVIFDDRRCRLARRSLGGGRCFFHALFVVSGRRSVRDQQQDQGEDASAKERDPQRGVRCRVNDLRKCACFVR